MATGQICHCFHDKLSALSALLLHLELVLPPPLVNWKKEIGKQLVATRVGHYWNWSKNQVGKVVLYVSDRQTCRLVNVVCV
jgi:hypothetical protein